MVGERTLGSNHDAQSDITYGITSWGVSESLTLDSGSFHLRKDDPELSATMPPTPREAALTSRSRSKITRSVVDFQIPIDQSHHHIYLEQVRTEYLLQIKYTAVSRQQHSKLV
jgi:hypothetical protein